MTSVSSGPAVEVRAERAAMVDDYMRLADTMAQRLAEYLYDHPAGEGKRAGDDYAAARVALRDALVSGVVESAHTGCPKFGECKAVGDHGYDIPGVLCADFGCAAARAGIGRAKDAGC